MGFGRSFISGATLTAGIIYFTTPSHQQNRRIQAAALQSQSKILNSLLESKSEPLYNGESEKLLRDESKSFTQALKIRWNEEIKNIFWWIHSRESNGVRDEKGRNIIQLVGRKLFDPFENAHDLKDQAAANIHEAFESGKITTKRGIEIMKHQGSAEVGDLKEASTEKYADKMHGSGQKIIDKGDQFTHAALGETTSGLIHRPSSNSTSIEETLQNRYIKSDSLNKSVEETLNNRYRPIDNSD